MASASDFRSDASTGLWRHVWAYAGLVALVGWSAVLLVLDEGFVAPEFALDRPVYTFFALQVVAGIVYLLTLWELRRFKSLSVFVAVIVAGLAMRSAQFAAVPILETDYYRYLWDGAVTANGINPYEYSPEIARGNSSNVPADVRRLAEESQGVVDKVNHADLRTIYPPTAQGPFAVAYFVAPFRTWGLRAVWLAIDLGCLGLLLALFRKLDLPRINAAIYWLNPLLVKEIYNSAHMELTLVFPLLAALWAILHGRRFLGAGFLALATGAKLWPVIWLPLFLRYVCKTWRQACAAVLVFGGCVCVLAIPILLSTLDAGSGFVAYGESWRMNESLHLLIDEGLQLINPKFATTGARIVVGLLLAVVTTILAWRLKPNDSKALVSALLCVTAMLFLFSPTQFPWYFMWMLPLLALRPMWSLLGLTVTLPLYYVRFRLHDMGIADQFDYGWVWLEFAPIWLLLGLEVWIMRTRTNQHDASDDQSAQVKVNVE